MPLHCYACKATLAENAKFCSKCGTKQEITCQACTANLPITAKYCGMCGHAVTQSGSKTGDKLPKRAAQDDEHIQRTIKQVKQLKDDLTSFMSSYTQLSDDAKALKGLTGSKRNALSAQLDDKVLALESITQRIHAFNLSEVHPSYQTSVADAIKHKNIQSALNDIQSSIESIKRRKAFNERAGQQSSDSFMWLGGLILCVLFGVGSLNFSFGIGVLLALVGACWCFVMFKTKRSDAEDDKWRAIGASEEEVSLRREARDLEDEISSAESDARSSNKSAVDRMNAQQRAESAKVRLSAVNRDLNRLR